jgi:hypothetical protein
MTTTLSNHRRHSYDPDSATTIYLDPLGDRGNQWQAYEHGTYLGIIARYSPQGSWRAWPAGQSPSSGDPAWLTDTRADAIRHLQATRESSTK